MPLPLHWRFTLFIHSGLNSVLLKISVWLDPQNITFSENRVFVGMISGDEVMLDEGGPHIQWLVSL